MLADFLQSRAALVCLVWFLCRGSASLVAAPPQAPASPLTPAQALAEFRLDPGLKIELVAAEPTVESPVALAFDERGRLYVAENRGYPTGPQAGDPPLGRIALLEDRDGDGHFEHRTDFAGGLTFPNGLLCWRGGVIVTCAPDVLYLKDTDGDGRADVREVLFTGFSTAGSTQLRVSHPTLGVDNWVYLTSGLTGGNVTCPRFPDRPPVQLSRTDFRFRPDGDLYEAADGGAQFGQTFDDWGRRFICYNRVQIQHVVLPSRVLKRNPQLAFSETVQNCPVEVVPEPLKGHGAAVRLFPLSSNVTTADSHAGTFTAACGVTVYRGTGLPDRYRGGAFSCDPTGNLVHFDLLEPNGATFAARRDRDGSEFVASPDNWFRPVYLAQGPDGALYVCDMYRKTIEHPDYLPVEIRKHTDFESGRHLGRIYRIRRDDLPEREFQARRNIDFPGLGVAELCQALSHSDSWSRATAQRLLLERRDPDSRRPIERLLGGDAMAAISALRLLESWGQLDNAGLLQGLGHPAAGVREVALDIAESRLAESPALLARVLELADDPAPRVRFQCAIACGSSPDPRCIAVLARIARHDSRDRWLRAAVFSSIAGREALFLEELLRGRSSTPPAATELYSELGRLLGASQPPDVRPRLVHLAVQLPAADFDIAASLLAGLAEALWNQGVSRDHGSVLGTLLAGDDADRAADRLALQQLFANALTISASAEQPLERRQAALSLLAHADFTQVGQPLLSLVDPQQPTVVQSGAVRALGHLHAPAITAALLDEDRFQAYPPALREEVLSAVLSAPQHLPGLLVALEQGAVPANLIDPLRRKRLTEHRDSEIRERAARIYAGLQSGDRTRVFEEYKSLLSLTPDPENGRAAFKKTCAACHRLDREGMPVGPDLFGIRNQPKEAILLHILVPEAEITPGFVAYTLETRSGQVLTGLLVAETATSVTLRQQLGKEDTVLRSDIESLVASRLSLMPQGLEKSLNRQELADLVSYLKGEKKPE